MEVQKAGYFPASRSFVPIDGEMNFVRIQLLSNEPTMSIDAQAGGWLPISDETALNFPANGVVLADGTFYEGMIQVAAHYLDPTSESIRLTMPGNLTGVNEEETVGLATFGMVAVEISTESGAELFIATDEEVRWRMNVPTELQTNAPDTIPLWYFNETKGLWEAEGHAVYSAGKYLGKIRHFSFWNCDVPFPVINLSGGFDDNNQTLFLEASTILISSDLYGSTSSSLSSTGLFSSLVPKDEVLNLKLFDLCNQLIFESEIGPFSANENLGLLSPGLPPCFPPCTVTTPTILSFCDCNGTPNDPADDLFIYYISVDGINNSDCYFISGDDFQTNLGYGEVEGPFGPFPSIEGDLNILIEDCAVPNCMLPATVTDASQSCSCLCNIDPPIITIVYCDHNGSLSNPSDDVFGFSIQVNGISTGSSYSLSGDFFASGLLYGTTHSFLGPFLISDGIMEIIITDSDDANCISNSSIVPPDACSPLCVINTPLVEVTCMDNGTPLNPDDDLFSYTINIEENYVGAKYSITGDDNQYALLSNIWNGPFGPFSISLGDLNLTISDLYDQNCLIEIVVEAPDPCSD